MLDTILLGFVQGITEFLPVSSSAHLVFFQHFLGWKSPEILYDVLLHVATLLSVLIYFRKELVNILLTDRRALVLLIVSSIPTAVIGILAKDFIEKMFSSVRWSAVFLIITGFIIFFAQRFSRERKKWGEFKIWEAFVVGVVQGIAVLPGISRSGSTIACGMLLGWDKAAAAKYSFILSIPAVLGAALLAIREYSANSAITAGFYAGGALTALLAGIAAIYILFRIIYLNKFELFAYYCWAAGALVLILGGIKG